MRIQLLLLWFAIAAPLSADAQNNVASIVAALQSQHYSEAKQLSEAALQQSPADARLWALNGMALEHLSEVQHALKSYNHALQIEPDYVPALEAAAQLQYARGSQDAIPYLNRLLQRKPADETAHAMLAALAYKRGDCPSAIAEYGRSHPLIDTRTDAQEQLSSCLVEEGKPRDAIAALTQNSSRKPLDPDGLDLLAEAYEATGDTPNAVETLRTAIVKDPNQARFYVDFADIALVHASYQVGIDMLDIGLRHLPRTASLYVARGVLYVKLGKYERSDADFKTAEDLDPRVDAAASARGMAAFEQNHLPEAETMIRQRLARNPHDAFLSYLLAEVLLRRGASAGTPAFDEAVHAAQNAIRLQPHFELARDVLARLYLQTGKLPQAIEQSRIAVQEDPSDQTALYHLILALRKTGRTAELPPLLKKLTELRQDAMRKENSERHFKLQEEAHR